jgi:hypothetical protein
MNIHLHVCRGLIIDMTTSQEVADTWAREVDTNWSVVTTIPAILTEILSVPVGEAATRAVLVGHVGVYDPPH